MFVLKSSFTEMFLKAGSLSFKKLLNRQVPRYFTSTIQNVTIVDRKETALQVLDKVGYFILYLIFISYIN